MADVVTVKAMVPLPWVERGAVVTVPRSRQVAALLSSGRLVEVPADSPSGVPDGTVDEVLAWVDADGADAWARAGTAYHVEQQRGQPRSTLLDELSARLARAGGVPPPDGEG